MNIINELAEKNTWEYNHLKAIEELIELSEVLIKKVTKRGGEKEPTDQSIIDEIGDVIIRIRVLQKLYGKISIQTRYIDKLRKIEGNLKSGKYEGRV